MNINRIQVFVIGGMMLGMLAVSYPVDAASVIVRKDIVGAVGGCIGGELVCTGPRSFGFIDPSISIEYRALVKNAETGEIIPPGGSVIKGTRVELVCTPSRDHDISWFTPGGLYDSPYGRWRTPGTVIGAACESDFYVTSDLYGKRRGYIYSSLEFNNTAKKIDGISALTGCTPQADGCSVTCTADTEGSIPAQFTFSAVEGSYYGGLLVRNSLKAALSTDEEREEFEDIPSNKCLAPKTPLSIRNIDRKALVYLNAGTKQGTFWNTYFWKTPGGVNSVQLPSATIPYSINVITARGEEPGTPNLASDGECKSGTVFGLRITSSDPDGDSVRYGIDWNADDTIDAYAPETGYVDSGTVQTAYRTFLAGQKTVRVIAKDITGLSSGWQSISIQCSQSNVVDGFVGDVAEGGLQENGGAPQTSEPALSIRAIPSLVRTGDPTRIHWDATNVESCTVSAPNGDMWTGTQSPNVSEAPPTGGRESSPIVSSTIYTLSCITAEGEMIAARAKVDILPSFREL